MMLKRKPQGDLNQSWILRPAYLAERRPVGDIAIRVKELCVIENVERLRAKLKIRALPQRNQFVHT